MLFPDWLSSRVVFSSFPVDSRRTTAAPPSDGPGGTSSGGGGEGSASSVGWEEKEGSVRMFLEITGETKHFNFLSKSRKCTPKGIFPHESLTAAAPTSCRPVVVGGGRAAAERAETGHDEETQRHQDDLRTNTHGTFVAVNK